MNRSWIRSKGTSRC